MIINNILKIFWEIVLLLPQVLCAILFYLIIYILLIFIFRIGYKYLIKPVMWLYCAFQYLIVSNINYKMHVITQKPLYSRIDTKLFEHLNKIENVRIAKVDFKAMKTYIYFRRICICLLFTVLFSILVSLSISAENLPSIWTIPTDIYLSFETDKCDNLLIANRNDRIVFSVISDTAEIQVEEQAVEETITIIYTLNEEGWYGANIRETPEIDKTIPIVTTVAKNALLESLNEEIIDDSGIAWTKVKTERGMEGWISRKLIKIYEDEVQE